MKKPKENVTNRICQICAIVPAKLITSADFVFIMTKMLGYVFTIELYFVLFANVLQEKFRFSNSKKATFLDRRL